MHELLSQAASQTIRPQTLTFEKVQQETYLFSCSALTIPSQWLVKVPMGKQKSKKQNKKNKGQVQKDGFAMVDPAQIRFQHSKIRPYFSGCGRSVTDALQQIRDGKLKPTDLPPIQVIVSDEVDESNGKHWYFSLNNRRLWVLKRCREDGLLENNTIKVRLRSPKSAAELERYSVKNCALDAKFMRERPPPQAKSEKALEGEGNDVDEKGSNVPERQPIDKQSE